MKRGVMLALTCIFLLAIVSEAQYTPWLYCTLLPKEQMDEIIGEASGESAWRTIAAINAFNRDRSAEEFQPRWAEMPRVVGSTDIEQWYQSTEPVKGFLDRMHQSAAAFRTEREPFLLYP